MKSTKQLIAYLLIFLFVFQLRAEQPVEKKQALYGVNLASACFGSNVPGVYNKDYAYPTPANLDYMKSKGFEMVRLPFLWERIQREVYAELDEVELGRLRFFVDEAAKRDIKVLFDLHNYGRRYINNKRYIIGGDSLSIEHLSDVWSKIANEFKDHNNIYGYGLMNEPHDMLDSTPWAKIAQACINEIRKVDAKTTIFVGGDSWSSAERWMEFSDNLKYLYDPSDNLVFEVHVYFDIDASGTYKKSYEEEKTNPYRGIERMQPFIKWLSENNKQGFVGEYGVPDNDERWLVSLDNFLKYIQSKGLGGAYWAAGPRWGKYFMAIEPVNGEERPQMKVVEKYLKTN